MWRRPSRRIISRLPVADKNYVLSNGSGIAAGTTTSIVLVSADGAGNDNSVEFPCKVQAIYLVMNARSATDAGGGTFAVAMYKNPGNALGAFNPNNTFTNVMQSHIFWWQRMSNNSQGLGVVFNGWVKIPKRFQIMNEGDTIVLGINFTVDAYSHCTNAVYKWRA